MLRAHSCLPLPSTRAAPLQGPVSWHPASDSLKAASAKAAAHAKSRGVDISKIALAHSLRCVWGSCSVGRLGEPSSSPCLPSSPCQQALSGQANQAHRASVALVCLSPLDKVLEPRSRHLGPPACAQQGTPRPALPLHPLTGLMHALLPSTEQATSPARWWAWPVATWWTQTWRTHARWVAWGWVGSRSGVWARGWGSPPRPVSCAPNAARCCPSSLRQHLPRRRPQHHAAHAGPGHRPQPQRRPGGGGAQGGAGHPGAGAGVHLGVRAAREQLRAVAKSCGG